MLRFINVRLNGFFSFFQAFNSFHLEAQKNQNSASSSRFNESIENNNLANARFFSVNQPFTDLEKRRQK